MCKVLIKVIKISETKISKKKLKVWKKLWNRRFFFSNTTATLLMYNQCQMFWISNDQYGEQSETLFGTVLGLQ